MHLQYKALPLAMLLSFCSLSQAASLTSNGYSQNFDAIGSSTTLPTDWSIWTAAGSHSDWTTSITANGASKSVQSMTSAGSSLVSALLDTAITTSIKNANAYNVAHATTPTDRVIATAPTGNAGTAIQLSLTNNTGASFTSLLISYDIVKFSDGTKQSTTDGTYPTGEELPGYQLFYSLDNSTWSNVSALNPVSTANGTNPAIALGTPSNSGASPSLNYSVTSINNYLLTFSSAVASNSTIRLRWVDDNAVNVSPDQMIGLNNVVISTVAAIPEPETYAMLIAGLGLLSTNVRRRKQSN